MEIEACGDYDDMITNSGSLYGNRIGHQVRAVGENNISHLVKAYPMQGWGGIKNAVKPLNANANANAEAGLTYTWGDKDGDKLTVSGSVSISDDRGNHADVTVSQNSDGKGSVEASAGVGTKDDRK